MLVLNTANFVRWCLNNIYPFPQEGKIEESMSPCPSNNVFLSS